MLRVEIVALKELLIKEHDFAKDMICKNISRDFEDNIHYWRGKADGVRSAIDSLDRIINNN